jgi:hypothetical protein
VAAGRCEGCGRTGSACKIANHTTECALWLALFAEDPSLALSPQESYRRWVAGGKAAERAAHVQAVTSDAAMRRAAGADRFRRKDILAD